jgi:cyclopropane fatty-acyl-phospholipid synthase-like methyltransferase
VYDKKNALVIGFCADERPANVINSIAVYSRWINLYFFEGGTLPDPDGLLQGSGTSVRSIRITSAADLDAPAVRALLAEARKRADPPLNPKAPRRIIFRQTRKA